MSPTNLRTRAYSVDVCVCHFRRCPVVHFSLLLLLRAHNQQCLRWIDADESSLLINDHPPPHLRSLLDSSSTILQTTGSPYHHHHLHHAPDNIHLLAISPLILRDHHKSRHWTKANESFIYWVTFFWLLITPLPISGLPWLVINHPFSGSGLDSWLFHTITIISTTPLIISTLVISPPILHDDPNTYRWQPKQDWQAAFSQPLTISSKFSQAGRQVERQYHKT